MVHGRAGVAVALARRATTFSDAMGLDLANRQVKLGKDTGRA